MDPDFSLNMDALNNCDEEDLQLVHAKLSVINKELMEVREILTKHLSRSSSCKSSCTDSEMGDAKEKGESPSQSASPAFSQRSSMEMEMAVFKSSDRDAVCRE